MLLTLSPRLVSFAIPFGVFRNLKAYKQVFG